MSKTPFVVPGGGLGYQDGEAEEGYALACRVCILSQDSRTP
jgi:hypothetical protein